MTGAAQPALTGGRRTFLEEVCHQGCHRAQLGERVEAETSERSQNDPLS